MMISGPTIRLTLAGIFALWAVYHYFFVKEPMDVDFELPFKASVVYVEDTSEDGLTAGNFGDLVLLDGQSQKRKLLTHDRYYNMAPTWFSDGRRVLFESKRDPELYGLGLSWDSSLYTIDVVTRELNAFKGFHALDSISIGGVKQPALSPDSKKLIYHAYHDGELFIILADLHTGNTSPVQKASHFMDVFWSQSGHWFTIAETHFKYLPNIMVLPSDQTSGIAPITVGKPTQIDAGVAVCLPGEWIDDESFYFSCSNRRTSRSHIFTYSIRQKTSELITVVPDWEVYDVSIIDENRILFLGNSYSQDSPFADFLLVSEIFIFDRVSDSLTQVTHNMREKTNMRVFRH